MNKQLNLMRSVVLASMFVAAGAWAQGVPMQLDFSANLTSSGVPVTTPTDLTFRIFTTATGGTAPWTEVQTSVPVTNGLVFTRLGGTTAFPANLFDGGDLWLEVTVGTTTLSPRSQIVSVPYAIRAGVANTIEGLTPTDLQRRVVNSCTGSNAVQTVNADGTVTCVAIPAVSADITSVNTAAGSGLTGGAASGDVNLSLASCGSGLVLKSNGTSWGCAPDDDTTYTAGAGLQLNTGAFALSTCPNGQILKSTGAGWSCQADVDTNTTYSAGAGLTLASTTFSIGTGAISNTMLANSAVTINATAPLQIGGSVSLGGSTTLLLQTCGANGILKMNAGGTAWTCGTDVDTDTNTTYTAGNGLSLAGTTFNVSYGGTGGGSGTSNNVARYDHTHSYVGSVGATAPLSSSGGLTPTISLTGTVPIANGGTGANTVNGAHTSLDVPGLSHANTWTIGNQLIQTGTSGTAGLYIRGATGQTADLQRWQDSAGTNLATVSAGGDFMGGTYNYRTPVPGTYWIPANLFQQYSGNATISRNTDYIYFTGPASGFAQALLLGQFDIPNGARVTSLGCIVLDGSSTQDFSAGQFYILHSPKNSTGLFAMFATTLATSGNPATKDMVASTTGSTAINKVTTHYQFWLNLRASAIDGANLRFYGCEVNYTVSDTAP